MYVSVEGSHLHVPRATYTNDGQHWSRERPCMHSCCVENFRAARMICKHVNYTNTRVSSMNLDVMILY